MVMLGSCSVIMFQKASLMSNTVAPQRGQIKGRDKDVYKKGGRAVLLGAAGLLPESKLLGEMLIYLLPFI